MKKWKTFTTLVVNLSIRYKNVILKSDYRILGMLKWKSRLRYQIGVMIEFEGGSVILGVLLFHVLGVVQPDQGPHGPHRLALKINDVTVTSF